MRVRDGSQVAQFITIRAGLKDFCKLRLYPMRKSACWPIAVGFAIFVITRMLHKVKVSFKMCSENSVDVIGIVCTPGVLQFDRLASSVRNTISKTIVPGSRSRYRPRYVRATQSNSKTRRVLHFVQIE